MEAKKFIGTGARHFAKAGRKGTNPRPSTPRGKRRFDALSPEGQKKRTATWS